MYKYGSIPHPQDASMYTFKSMREIKLENEVAELKATRAISDRRFSNLEAAQGYNTFWSNMIESLYPNTTPPS